MVVKGSGGWLDWITPKGQKTSLSLFQIYLWTWIVLAGSIYVAVLTGEPLAVTTDVLALLGIAGLGSVTSRFISVTQDKNQPSAQPVFNDIFKTDDVFDLYKLQMFLFTVGTALYVAARIAFDKTFPVLDANLLLLLGISNGIYVASKAAGGASPFRVAEQLKSDLDVLGQAKQATDADVIRLDTAISDADTAIRNAAANNQPTDKPEADKKMLEQQKAAADAKAKSLADQIAKKTTEYKDAVSKI